MFLSASAQFDIHVLYFLLLFWARDMCIYIDFSSQFLLLEILYEA